MTINITQEDRDAAAEVAVLVEMRELIRAGRADHHAEPFARHREAAEAKERERIVKWLRDQETKGFDRMRSATTETSERNHAAGAVAIQKAATAIERGEHAETKRSIQDLLLEAMK